jgi:hypothetical protein
MAIPPSKRPKIAAIKQEAVTDAAEFLQTLPDKPKEELSLREAVDQLRDQIRDSLARGYTYSDLATLLGERGITISASTLKNYVPSGKRQAAKDKQAEAKPKSRRGKKEPTRQVEDVASLPQPAVAEAFMEDSTSAEPESTKTPRRRGGRTAAKASSDTLAKVESETKTRRVSRRASSQQEPSSEAPTRSTPRRGRRKPPA